MGRVKAPLDAFSCRRVLSSVDRPIGRANMVPYQMSQRFTEVLDVKERAAALAILLMNLLLGHPQGASSDWLKPCATLEPA